MIGAAFSHAQGMAAFWDDETPSNPKKSRKLVANDQTETAPEGGTLQVDVIIQFFEVMWVKTPKRDFSATPEKGQKGDDEAGES